MAAIFAPIISLPSASRLLFVARSFVPTASVSLLAPIGISLNIPTLLPGIFESILRAVPKKKTSHSKKRMRQLAGKALKDITALNRCSACGRVKRSHMLCEHCVRDIKDLWLGKKKPEDKTSTDMASA